MSTAVGARIYLLAFASMTRVCKARPCSTDRLPAGLPRVDSIVGRCSLRAAPAAEHPILRASAERYHALVDRVHSRAQNELGVPRRRPRFLFPGKQRRARVGISFLSIGHEIDNQTSTQPREMNMNAFKQTLVAIAAAATLGATGLASNQASANDYGYGYGSYGGYG